jgi:hypothetical protein
MGRMAHLIAAGTYLPSAGVYAAGGANVRLSVARWDYGSRSTEKPAAWT